MLKLHKIKNILRIRSSIYGYEFLTNNRSLTSDKNSNHDQKTINKIVDDPKDSIDQPEHPIKRSMKILKNDMKTLKNYFTQFSTATAEESRQDSSHREDITDNIENLTNNNRFIREHRNSLGNTANINDNNKNSKSSYDFDQNFQTHCDILIIGGGGIGSSVAFWLKHKTHQALNVVVIEMDPTYARASTALSVGGLRQQFSLEENIEMSLFGAEFIRNSHEYLGSDCDLNFTPHGYLMLASADGADTLNNNSKLQNEMGARNEILTVKQLRRKFPWLNTDGIELGCHGLEKEGWFDPWALLMGYKRRAIENGTHYVTGEVIGFERSRQQDIVMPGIEDGSYKRLDKVVVKLANGEVRTIKFAMAVLAAGAQSGHIARLAEIGTGTGMLSVPLPVEPRKRYVYVFETQGINCPGLNTPLTIDPTNTYFRREGFAGLYLGGRSPSYEQEPAIDDLSVDYNYFDTDVWPHLAKRVPAFESIKVKNAWAGYYEYNTFDKNGIIGPHPYYNNLFIATGFSGHGIQQTPAVGRAICEIMFERDYQTIDLKRFGFDRFIVDQPMYESNIV